MEIAVFRPRNAPFGPVCCSKKVAWCLAGAMELFAKVCDGLKSAMSSLEESLEAAYTARGATSL